MEDQTDVRRTSSEDNLAKNNQTEIMAHNEDKENNQNVDSEYESVYDSSNEHDNHNEPEEDFESGDSVVLEREEGDGQESVSNKKVDDDEDKKNPQYIPKRGTFYEHDDRTLEDSENREVVEKVEKPSKKIVWVEKKERWSHDRYNDDEQAPKSRSELVSIYGYDIRNEDGPPKARRRRRYGRGPNKYTRTWEDEDAYKATKPIKSIKPKGKNREEYPSLDGNNEENKNESVPINDDQSQGPKNEELEQQAENKFSSKTPPKQTTDTYQNAKSVDQSKSRTPHQRVGTGRVVKCKLDIQQKDYRGFTKSREFSNSNTKSDQVISRAHKIENAQDYKSNENKVESLEKDLNELNIQENSLKGSNKQQGNHRQNAVPPRMQAEQKGSKRYSSLRQRSLPETAAPNYTQPANFYPSEFTATTPTAQPQQLLSQPNSLHAPAAQVPQIPPPPLAPLPQPVSVTSNPILQAPPQFAATFPQAAAPFLQSPVATPSFIQQTAPPLINYVQSQPQFPQAAPYQGYQQFNAVNQAELYQCQGGTTYYSTQTQQLGQRLVPQKRPKAAIPIVAPPILEPRGRGRSTNIKESLPLLDNTEILMNDSNSNYEDSIVYVQQ